MVLKKRCRIIPLLKAAAIVVCSVQLAQAGDVSVNLNLGAPLPVVVAPPPVYVPMPEPVYVEPPPRVYVPSPEPAYLAPPRRAYDTRVEIQVQNDIDFVFPSALGFYVAVGVPYDLFYLNNSYYLYRDGRWLRAASSRGPWVVQRYRELPRGLRRHKVERVREYRDREYAVYRRDRDHYRGRHFRSGKEAWREARRDERRHEKDLRKDERRYEKELRKDERRYEKEQRKDERRHEKEERREHRERHGD